MDCSRIRIRAALPTIALLTPLCLWVGSELVQAKASRAQVAATKLRVAELEAQLGSCMASAAELSGKVGSEVEVPLETPEQECEAPAVKESSVQAFDPATPGAFAFVRADRMVLDTHAKLSGLDGELRGDAVGRSGAAWAERDAYLYAQPGFDELDRARFDLYGASGKLCEVKAGKAYVRAEATGDFSMGWGGGLEEEFMAYTQRVWDESAPEPGDAVLETLGRERLLMAGPARLEVEFETLSGDCDGALWARASAFESPGVWKEGAHVDQLEALHELMRGSAAYAEARRHFEQYRREVPEDMVGASWTGHESDTFDAQTWRDASGKEMSFVTMGTVESCGGLDTQFDLRVLGGEVQRGPGLAEAMFTLGGEDYIVSAGDAYDDVFLLKLRAQDGDEDEGFDIVRELVTEFWGCPC